MSNEEQKNERTSFISWPIRVQKTVERNKAWYVIAGIFLAICLFICFFEIKSWRPVFLGYNSNFLFAIIIVLACVIMFVNSRREQEDSEFYADGDGLKIDEEFFDYDKIKDFSILYKPKEDIQKLYFEFKSPVQQRISINLEGQNPITVRNFFLRYLEEDLERVNEPLSEQLTKMLRL